MTEFDAFLYTAFVIAVMVTLIAVLQPYWDKFINYLDTKYFTNDGEETKDFN